MLLSLLLADVSRGGGGEPGSAPGHRRPRAPGLGSRRKPSPSAEPPSGERPTAVPAFEELYEQHVSFVWRSARRLGVSDANLEDVVQDVFVTVHRKLDSFEGRSSLRTWLYGITLHVVRNRRRSRRRKPLELSEKAVLALDNAPTSERQLPDALAERHQAEATLHHILAQLPDALREILVMAELENMSGPDIAQVTGLKTATVYGRLRKARSKLNQAVKRHLITTRRSA